MVEKVFPGKFSFTSYALLHNIELYNNNSNNVSKYRHEFGNGKQNIPE